MAELQVRFGIGNRQYFEKRFLPAYSTGFKVPETRGGKNFLFFKTLLDGPLIYAVAINCNGELSFVDLGHLVTV